MRPDAAGDGQVPPADAPTPVTDGGTQTELPVMAQVHRHDIHKLRGRTHDSAADEVAGVPVNQPVPRGADADAALLSRPRGEPEQTVDTYASPRRLSLLTGDRATAESDPDAAADSALDDNIDQAVRALAQVEKPQAAHRAWLDGTVPALFAESVYYPYTSAKYHVLLTAALLSNYRQGATFDDLWLVVDPPGTETDIVPHRTVLRTPALALRITADPTERPAAPLGPAPARSFADVWSRVSGQPLATDGNRRAMILDAQLRRIRAWSTALQYLDDYVTMVRRLGGAVR